eukprot:scaffold1413_cov117-Cylindrotheca_fusiformis.AAC.8
MDATFVYMAHGCFPLVVLSQEQAFYLHKAIANMFLLLQLFGIGSCNTSQACTSWDRLYFRHSPHSCFINGDYCPDPPTQTT